MTPHISPFEFESPIYAGENVQITCHVPKGDRPLSIYWQFKNNTSKFDFNATVIGDRASFLSVTSVGPDDAGNYTCIAQNAAGIDRYTAQLSIIGRMAFTIKSLFYTKASKSLFGFCMFFVVWCLPQFYV